MEELVNDMVGTSLSAALTQVNKLIETYGEEAVDLALFVVQMNSIGALVMSWISLISLLGFIFIGVPYAKRVWDRDDSCKGDVHPMTVITIIGMAVGTAISLFELTDSDFFDPIVWVSAMGWPEVEVARSLLNKVL